MQALFVAVVFLILMCLALLLIRIAIGHLLALSDSKPRDRFHGESLLRADERPGATPTTRIKGIR